jgi:alpha-beta hydrolase superfamily lysophospholipase
MGSRPVDRPAIIGAKTVAIHRWDIDRPMAALHIVHGMAEHAGRYARLAARLNTAGIAVWAHDHRGHGSNPTPPVGLGHFADHDGWRALVDDSWSAAFALGQAYPGLPLYLFGHSMGSFVAQTLIAAHGGAWAGVVLCGSDGPAGAGEAILRFYAGLERRLVGFRSPSPRIDSLTFGRFNHAFKPNRTRFDWLSRDAGEVDKYIADPLCGFSLTTQSWCDFLDGRRAQSTGDHFARVPSALPIRIIAGAKDPVGDNGRGPRRLLDAYKAAGLTDVTLRLYYDARHELVNELNRDEVTDELIAWLQRPLTR